MKVTLPPECSRDRRAPVVRPRRRGAFGLVLSLLLPGLLCLDTAAAEPLRWSVTPYVWGTETKVDLTADGTPIGGDTVTFSDLVDARPTLVSRSTWRSAEAASAASWI